MNFDELKKNKALKKVIDKIEGRPKRGKYTYLRRFFQLAILFLFSYQLVFNGYWIEGSLASSRVLTIMALFPLAILGLYYIYKGMKEISEVYRKEYLIGRIGFVLIAIGLVLAFFYLFQGTEPTLYVKVVKMKEGKQIVNYYTNWPLIVTTSLLTAGIIVMLVMIWHLGHRGGHLVHIVLQTMPIFLAMTIAASFLLQTPLVVLGGVATVNAFLAIALYAFYVHKRTSDAVLAKASKDFASAFAIAAVGMGIATVVFGLAGPNAFATFKYPMMDPIAWLEHAAASRGFTLESVTALLVVLFLYSVLGRFFCGWVCPMDLLFSIFEKKLNLPRDPPQMRFHRASKWEKVVPIVAIVIYVVLSYMLAMPFFTTISPVAGTTKFFEFLVGVIYNIPAATLGSVIAFGYITTFALGVNIVAEKVFKIKRFWCKYVCPIGNFYGFAMNYFSPFRLKVVAPERCTKCNLCSMVCPMSIDLVHYIQQGKDIVDHRCFHCGRCTEVCPTSVLELGFRLRQPEEKEGEKGGSSNLPSSVPK